MTSSCWTISWITCSPRSSDRGAGRVDPPESELSCPWFQSPCWHNHSPRHTHPPSCRATRATSSAPHKPRRQSRSRLLGGVASPFLSVVRCSLFVVRCSLFVVRCSLFVVTRCSVLSEAGYLPLQRTTNNEQRTRTLKQPCHLINHQRADIGQGRHIGEREQRPAPGAGFAADDGQG